MTAIQKTPASEYLVADSNGRLSGVLARSGPSVAEHGADEAADPVTPNLDHVTSCAHGFTLPKHHFLGKDTISQLFS